MAAIPTFRTLSSTSRQSPSAREKIGPQPGPQTEFLACGADIVVYGGSAGGGKTWALLIEALRHISNPDFGAVVFRRTMKDVKQEGGIWDATYKIYPKIGGEPNLTERFWQFPSTATIQFAGLEHEHDKFSFKGAEICLLAFDELTEFTETQFFYLITRNRSTSGVKPYVRATTNPKANWVKRLLAPWVDRKFENKARSGEVRWFKRKNNQIIWLDAKPEYKECSCQDPECEDCFPSEKSICFIRASVFDNKILLDLDPGYVTNLKVQSEEDKRVLLYGDWDVKPAHRVINEFDDDANITPWREIPVEWRTRVVCMDFGGVNSAFVILAEDPETKIVYVTGEWWPGRSASFPEMAKEIRKANKGTPTFGYGGNRTTEEGWRQGMRKEGIPMAEPKVKEPAVRYQCLNDGFKACDLYVMDNCQMTIDMINSFERPLDGDGRPMDEFDDSPFHLVSALGYGYSSMRPPKGPPRKIPIRVAR